VQQRDAQGGQLGTDRRNRFAAGKLRMNQKEKFPLGYFLITYLFTWAFQIPVMLESQKIISLPVAPQILLLLSIFGPFAAAFSLTFREDGLKGARRLFKRGFDFNFSWKIYLFVTLTPILTAFLAFLATGGSRYNAKFPALLGTFVIFFFLGGSFGEEFGWRGFALPRLLKIYGPFAASLVIGVFWTIWHLPLFGIAGTSQFYTPLWLYFIYVTALSVQYTWVFRRSDGNVFACLLLHTFTNITVEIFPLEAVDGVDRRIYFETLIAVLVAAVVGLTDFRRPNERG
jgi:hypothetical protein